MSYRTRVVKLSPGSTSVSFAWLSYTDVHMVTREGVVQRPVSSSPSNRGYVYNPASGSITFGIPGADLGNFSFEQIGITYKE